VNKIIYGVFLLGVILSQMPLIKSLYLGFVNRYRLRRSLREFVPDEYDRKRGRISKHIDRLMKATDLTKIYGKPEMFIIISLVIFLGVAFALYWTLGSTTAILMGSFCGMMPYMLMRVKLNAMRIGGSREGDIMMQELLSNYKINDYNMKEAIEVTAATIEDAPNSKRLLYDLAKGFNKAYTADDIKRVLDIFKYSLNTSWGNALASTMYFSQIHGIKVTNSLEDLSESLIKSRKVIEHGRRENNEASLMLKYLAPISYLLSVLCACKYFGFTLNKFIRYQFGTALGLQWFMIMAAFFISGVLINGFLSREKMDI